MTAADTDGSLLALRHAAAAIGADPLLVQGAGGNVSVKLDRVMWIKASGTWLAEAAARDILVPVALPPLRAAISAGDATLERAETFVIRELNATQLRPSIETSMHAALPHKVVVHVHSVDAIAAAVRADGMAMLEEKLAGLRWAFVPYRRPGVPLTRAMVEASPDGGADVLVLANHGLVVGADDAASAQALLAEVVARLAIAPRLAPSADPEAVATIVGGHGFRLPTDTLAHAIATDPASLAIAESGVLYPDHVVFLGGAPLAIDRDESLGAALERWQAAGYPRPKWVIIRGLGIAVADDIARGGDEMARCLAEVAARIPADCGLSFLQAEDIAALTDWDAEKYRQQLAKTLN
jgi:rhamnose utilization protein RhaD (predicted bifunctional aldolase and dehydrogenase)